MKEIVYRKKLREAAESQLAGPFGKLGRYVLKTQWGIEVPARGRTAEEETDPAGTRDVDGARPCAEADEGGPGAGRGKALLRRFGDFLGRFRSRWN